MYEFEPESYEYLLPDHWLIKEDNIWAIMHKRYVERVVELVCNTNAQRVIEVGCGDGWNCGKLVESGLDVVGVDWSKNGIEHARRMVPQAEFWRGDITDPKFLAKFDEPFEAACFVEVLEHIPPEDCVDVLRSVRDIVKIEGAIVLTTPSVNIPNNNPGHYRHFTGELLRNLFDEVGGLSLVTLEGYGDAILEHRHWQMARWINNRYFRVHPVYHYLNERYRHAIQKPTPEERCHGFIAVLKRVS